jgi:DNA transformation protein
MSRSLDLLTEACGSLPRTVRRMFGGYGFFAPNGGMFAGIVTDDEVILKLEDEAARRDLLAEGGHAWVYQGRDRPMTMASWIVVPEAFYDDPEQFGAWARRAHALVPAKRAAKGGASRRSKPTPAKRAPPKPRPAAARPKPSKSRAKPAPRRRSASHQ